MSSLEIDKTGSIMDKDVVDNDVHVKMQELTSKLLRVEAEMAKVQKEKIEQDDKYNEQRAKFQKIYMAKQQEVEELKQQLKETENKRDECLSELGQLLEDTVEVSSSSQTEVEHLHKTIKNLEEQLTRMNAEKGENFLLAPSNMISATKSLAKKVVSHLGSDVDKNAEDLDDSMRKAKEDADVMRGLIMPLEKEIAELKGKLKTSEERFVKYEKKIRQDAGANSCDMCINYEERLQAEQEQSKNLERQKEILKSNLEKFKENLAKETQFRKEMEEKWNEKKEEQKIQVKQLKDAVEAGKIEVQDLQSAFASMKMTVKEQLDHLRSDRESINAKMLKLQQENESLVGKNSQQLGNEPIDFPDNVADLQDLLLKRHEELIVALAAKESKEEELKTLRYEMQLFEDDLTTENFKLRQNNEELSAECHRFKTEITSLSIREIERKADLDTTKAQLHAISEENEKNITKINELENGVRSLREQLDNSEKVQRDFVLLSQSLQIQLEKIRGENTEVRWQHEDDVIECQGCRETFASAKKKDHCRHCGKIFCSNCLQHIVKSGPNQRNSCVCQVCHTLLNSETAPFFSQDAPHSSN